MKTQEQFDAECREVRENNIKTGKILQRLFDSGDWQQLGYKTWKAFLRDELGKTVVDAKMFMKIAEKSSVTS